MIDGIRGLAVVDMVIFHFTYDIFVIFMEQPDWPYMLPVRMWQRTICITFILISGFSFCLSRSHMKQAVKLMGTGILITAFTYFFMPSLVIYYGIIFFLGVAALITAGFHKIVKGRFAAVGLALSILLFLVFYDVSSGTLNLFFAQVQLPQWLYATDYLVFLGFPNEGFYSSDYFGVLPWIFVYFAGYFIYNLVKDRIINMDVFYIKIPFLEFVGRHSYIVYLVHQPVCFVVAGLAMGKLF